MKRLKMTNIILIAVMISSNSQRLLSYVNETVELENYDKILN